MTTFNGLRAGNIARQKEWDTGAEKLSTAFKATELAGEIGEAIENVLTILGMSAALAVAGGRAGNVVKKMERARLELKGSHATAADLADELADVVICADLLAEAAGIDLMAAIVAKFNATSAKYGLATRLEPMRYVRHVKRGSTYLVLGDAEMQISRPCRPQDMGGHLVQEGDKLTVYRAEDGTLWARFSDEFEDGRFEAAS